VNTPIPVLEVRDLHVRFMVRDAGSPTPLKAVDGVSFSLLPGRTLALVGESGCGKSTLAYAAVGMIQPHAGEVLFEGRTVAMDGRAARRAMAREMALVFQDPASALNPKLSVAHSIAEPMRIQGWTADRRRARVEELMRRVGLSVDLAQRTPDALSGGQKQRVVIARALALSPKVLVLDEPVSALDVSIRSQILNLLLELQQELGLSYVFISHDLSVVRHMADDLVVMYLGRAVEQGPAKAIFDQARHPYTQALLSAIPLPDPKRQRQRPKIILSGDLPSPLHPPPGCAFSTRCPQRLPRCSEQRPDWSAFPDATSMRCWLAGDQTVVSAVGVR
jgi:oligopeptide transport system ATP-binding protein